MKNVDWGKLFCENVGQNLVPVVVQHYQNGAVLMLGFMNEEALHLTKSTNFVHFFSRSKSRIWMKGETSGNKLEVDSIKIDCDCDTILISAKPMGVVCHTGEDTCFGNYNANNSWFLINLQEIIAKRIKSGDENSYVKKLHNQGLNKVAQKVGEEAVEVVIAALAEDCKLLDESADLLFHLLVLLEAKGVKLEDVIAVLQKRHKK